MSKLPMGSEFPMNTPIVKLLPVAVELKVRGAWGHLVAVAVARQTTPVIPCACAGCVKIGQAKIDPINNTVIASDRFIQCATILL